MCDQALLQKLGKKSGAMESQNLKTKTWCFLEAGGEFLIFDFYVAHLMEDIADTTLLSTN